MGGGQIEELGVGQKAGAVAFWAPAGGFDFDQTIATDGGHIGVISEVSPWGQGVKSLILLCLVKNSLYVKIYSNIVRIEMTDPDYIDISSVVQITDWDRLDEPLAGSRVKTTVAEPDTENLYIFKHPKVGREAQIWSELIASFISGDLLNWPVQHAQIAMHGEQVGNLLGHIYDLKSDSFYAGEQFCKHVDPDYDPKQGKRHTWALTRKIHDEFLAYDKDGKFLPEISEMYNLFWVRTVVFDTLISNTDRHAENWALLTKRPSLVGMAPFYDNATSLGCEFDEKSLCRKWFDSKGKIVASKVQSYAQNGCHHLRDGENRFKFEELARIVLNDFPEMRSEYEAVANLNLQYVEHLLSDIMSMDGLPEAAQMTSRRSDQIMALLHEGQSRVKRCLEEA